MTLERGSGTIGLGRREAIYVTQEQYVPAVYTEHFPRCVAHFAACHVVRPLKRKKDLLSLSFYLQYTGPHSPVQGRFPVVTSYRVY